MSVNSKMTALADEIRELSGTEETMGLDAMTNYVDEANTDVATEANLIAQIASALEGKTSGGENGGSNFQPKTCHISVDCSQLSSQGTLMDDIQKTYLSYTQINNAGEIEYVDIERPAGGIYDIQKALCGSRIYFYYGVKFSSPEYISNNNVIKKIIGPSFMPHSYYIFQIMDTDDSSTTTLSLRED